MAGYSKEEIEKFDARDLRISKSGIIQALLQSGCNVHEVEDNTKLAERYLAWVWGTKEHNSPAPDVESKQESVVTWNDFAIEAKLPIPTKEQKMILHEIVSQYKTDKLNHVKLLQQIVSKFGKYPSNRKSVQTVINEIPLEDLLN